MINLVNVAVNITGGTVSQSEIDSYVARAKKLYPYKQITAIDIAVDGEYVDLTYHWITVPFEHIRRQTSAV